jgi:hypothetical protein
MPGAIPPPPPPLQYVFIAWCVIKHRDNFTLTFPHHLLGLKLILYRSLHSRDYISTTRVI